MSIITNQIQIDAQQAIATINSIQASFVQHNAAVGAVASQYSNFNRAGNLATSTITQIDSAGKRVITTLRETANGYEILNVRVSQASASQRKMAEELERQRTLADNLAKAIKGIPTGSPNLSPTSLPGAVDPAKIGQAAAASSALNREQILLSATANNLTAAETRAMLAAYDGANRARNAMNSLKAAGEALKSKFEEFGKIAFATGVYRSISLLQSAFSEGANSAIEYSKSIGLIQTLADDNKGSFDQWSVAIRKVADEFGKPVIEVSKAAYAGLSAQVITTAGDMDFLRQATLLGRITNTETEQSINVLAAITNVFGKTAGTTEQIVNELFTTVDKGNVKIGELANVIGKSGSLAKQAGVSIQELFAAQIVLTQTGLNATEAGTLFNNVISQLLKPNEALTGQFKAMGFESGTAAVATLGFAGTMKALDKATAGSAEQLSKFFPDLRGLRGASVFTGEGIDKLVKAENDLAKSSGRASDANKELLENAGQKLADEAARIKNFFTVDLGQVAINAVAKVTEKFGGLSNIIEFITNHAIELGTAVAIAFTSTTILTFAANLGTIIKLFAGIRSAIIAASSAQIVFNGLALGSVGTLTLAVGGLLAGYFAVIKAVELYSEAQKSVVVNAVVPIQTQTNSALGDFTKENEARTAAFEKSTNKMTADYGAFVAAARIENQKLLDDSIKTSEKIAEALGNSLGALTDIAKKNFGNIVQEEQKAFERIASAKANSSDANEAFEKASYERALERVAANEKIATKALQDQVAREYKAADELAKIRAGKGAKTEKTEVPKQDASNTLKVLDLVEERNARLRQRLVLAIDTGDLQRAERLYNEIQANIDKLNNRKVNGLNAASRSELDFYNHLLQQSEVESKKLSDSLSERIAKERVELKNFEDLVKKTAEFGTKAFDNKTGQLIPEFKDPKQAIDKLHILQNEVGKAVKDLGLLDDPRLLKQLGTTLSEINKQFQEQEAILLQRIALLGRDKALSESFEGRKKAGEAEIALFKALNQELETNNTLLLKSAGYARQVAASIAATTQASSFTKNLGAVTGAPLSEASTGFNDKDQDRIKSLGADLDLLLAQTNKDIPRIKQEFEELYSIVAKRGDIEIPDPSDVNTSVKYIDLLDRMRTAISLIGAAQNGVNAANKEFSSLNEVVAGEQQNLTNIITAQNPALAGVIARENEVAATAAGLDGVSNAWQRLGDSIAYAAQKLQQYNATGTSGGGGGGGGAAEEQATGGLAGSKGGFLADFFSGRFARGTDIIPTMLSKGEYVIRAPMAEKYYSQLVAMNSGHAPIYRSQGGPVTNTRVGDINLHISGGQMPGVKQFASQLRRGIKQGTLRID